MVRSLWKKTRMNQLDFWGREVEREGESEKVLTWLQTGTYWTQTGLYWTQTGTYWNEGKQGYTEMNVNGDILKRKKEKKRKEKKERKERKIEGKKEKS